MLQRIQVYKLHTYTSPPLVPGLFSVEVLTISVFWQTRFPLGYAALREPAGFGPGHLQPRPQQELQAAGLNGAAQQRDQTHQQLHASGMTTGVREGRGG